MELQPNDLHLIYSSETDLLKAFNPAGLLLLAAACSDKAIGGDGFGHDARIPRGEFVLGDPVAKGTVPFGAWFLPILDYPGHTQMADYGRAGIGIHGGGSASPDPFAPDQGLYPTEGCLRVRNRDLGPLVRLVRSRQVQGGAVYLTVAGP